VYRANVLNNGDGNLDALMNELGETKARNDDGDTSMDSKMEDTPANYNQQNERRQKAAPQSQN
jgi:hypothetical protein